MDRAVFSPIPFTSRSAASSAERTAAREPKWERSSRALLGPTEGKDARMYSCCSRAERCLAFTEGAKRCAEALAVLRHR